MKIKRTKKGDLYIGLNAPGSGMHVSKHASGHVHIKDNKGKLHIDRPTSLAKAFDNKDIIEGIEKQNMVMGVVGICPLAYNIVVLDLTLNPSIWEGNLKKMCMGLHELTGGGICPYDTGLMCMWAGFCRAGKDPMPYVCQVHGKLVPHYYLGGKEVSII